VRRSARQIRNWRMAGLLPAPTVRGVRPVGAPPGRAPLVYGDAELETAQRALQALAMHARPGRPAQDLALLLFAAALPAPFERVVEAIRSHLASARSELDSLLGSAAEVVAAMPAEWRRSDAFDQSDAVARLEVESGGVLAATISSNLRKADQPTGDEDVHSVVLWLISTLLGEPPDIEDEEIAHRLLYAFDAHGLVESVAPGVAPVLPEGPTALINALAIQVRLGPFTLPEDVTETELIAARELASVLGAALHSVPRSEIRRYLGGDGVLSFWKPDDPLSVAQLLTYLAKLLREQPLDVTPIVRAVEEAGWLTTT
jgi:hypothetical protein